MKPPTCCECGRKQVFRPIVKLVDGTTLYVCEACWNALDLDRFLTR